MNNYTVKDSGDRRDFGTGAVRDMGAGKGRTDLLPFFALLELAKHFEAGAIKYGDENWRKGIPLRVYLDSAIRHLFKLALGMRDERHDLAALWNVACLIETQGMVDRGILPATLANLPNFYDADDGGDAYPPAWLALTPADDGPMTTAEMNDFLGVPEVGEDVKDLDDWLGQPVHTFTSGLNYGWVTDGPAPFTEKGDPIPVRVRRSLDLGDYPLDLRPQDRPYTRGHAEDTAARFNAGLPYADDKADAAISDHPLFQVNVIDGPDAAEYDDGSADPLAGKAYVIVEPAYNPLGSQWFVASDGRVSFKVEPGRACEPSRFHDRDSIRQGILSGRMKIVESGLPE